MTDEDRESIYKVVMRARPYLLRLEVEHVIDVMADLGYVKASTVRDQIAKYPWHVVSDGARVRDDVLAIPALRESS